MTYCQEYEGQEYADLSFGVENNGKLLAVVILYHSLTENGEIIDGCGRTGFFCYAGDASERDLKTVYKRVRSGLEDIVAKYSDAAIKYGEEFAAGGLSVPGLFLLESGATYNPALSCLIDLNDDLQTLSANIRKSYKSLLNWGRKNLELEVLNAQKFSVADIEEFRLLHISVAGRETRSERSWQLQYEMVKNDEAFVVFGRYEGKLVTASFYNFNRQHCYYGVGASVREMFDKPISHAPMWLAVEYAKERGCRWFETGDQAFAGFNGEDKKLLDIAKFKRGFGGEIMPRALITLAGKSHED